MTRPRPGFRRTAELKAGPLLVLIARLPRVVPFLAVLALVVGGLLLPGATGAVLLGLVLAFLGLQLFFAWPVLVPPQRLLRAAVLVMLVAAVATK